jgi:hypothetical protein
MKGKFVVLGLVVLAALFVSAVMLAEAQGVGPQWPAARAGVESGAAAEPALSAAEGLSATFTYQGRLKKGGAPVNATCDFQFGLYDAATLGGQVGVTQMQVISVTGELFTASLDFGVRAFNGEARWLGIRVNSGGER